MQSVFLAPHPRNMSTTEPSPVAEATVPNLRLRISGFVITVQLILFLVHWFVYQTCVFFWSDMDSRGSAALRVSASLLSVSFVGASLLAFRYWNVCVRSFYRVAAVWLGFLNFLFLAACMAWIAYVLALALRLNVDRSNIAAVAFGLAILAGVYGVLNARWTRVKRVAVELGNLPESWRGRTAAVVSDLHLGAVNGAGFLQRIVKKLNGLRPDVVLLPGDLYDGTTADFDGLVAPLKELASPFGVYFVTGNHEEFSDRTKYLRAVSRAGVRVLNNEKVNAEGLQIVGVHDWESSDPERLRSLLEASGVDRERASVLMIHVPRTLAIAARAGISLQVSGHTHGGQMFPFTWLTQRIFGEYTHGLRALGSLKVYTSSGAGTWGPPMRVGTEPEIVLIKFK